jgi:uncharacterized protein (AIM24 family)
MSYFNRAPTPLPDLAEVFDLEGISCQIVGAGLPSLSVAVQPGQSVEINPAALLWKDEAAVLTAASDGAVLARGPARLGLSLRLAGQIFPLPLLRGDIVQVRTGQFLLASGVERHSGHMRGLADRITGGDGAAFDSFRALDQTAVVWVQAAGGVLERALADGEALDLRVDAFLVKDGSVRMETVIAGHGFAWPSLRLKGPGRAALQTGALPAAEPVAAADPAANRQRMFGLDLPFGRRM